MKTSNDDPERIRKDRLDRMAAKFKRIEEERLAQPQRPETRPLPTETPTPIRPAQKPAEKPQADPQPSPAVQVPPARPLPVEMPTPIRPAAKLLPRPEEVMPRRGQDLPATVQMPVPQTQARALPSSVPVQQDPAATRRLPEPATIVRPPLRPLPEPIQPAPSRPQELPSWQNPVLHGSPTRNRAERTEAPSLTPRSPAPALRPLPIDPTRGSGSRSPGAASGSGDGKAIAELTKAIRDLDKTMKDLSKKMGSSRQQRHQPNSQPSPTQDSGAGGGIDPAMIAELAALL